MNLGMRLSVWLGAAGVAAALGAFLWSRIKHWRRKDPAEVERLRRLDINRRGRIAAGKIVDLIEQKERGADSRLVLYKYEVAGVTYEAAQDVAAVPGVWPEAHSLAGQPASIKYDPKIPTNSIIACEDWSGLPDLKAEARPAGRSIEAPGKTLGQS